MTHLRPDELSAMLDGALEGAPRERAERHLAECASCREALAALGDQDATLRAALEHDPGEAYFETFAARVEDRIRAAGLTGAQSRLGREGAWGWLSSPRRLAWVGTAAVLVVGAAIVMISGQPERSLLQSPEVLRRVEPQRPTPSESKRESDALSDTRDLAKEDDRAGAARDEKGVVGLVQAPRQEAARPLVTGGDAASQTAPAPATAPQAAPGRAQETRRTAAGEDVPVAKSTPFAAPPPTSAEGNLRIAKPRAAQPMESQPAQGIAPRATALDKVQAGSLCGRVIDNRQQPVPGATVALADRGVVVTAGPDGRFCLDAPEGLHELSVMAVGYEPSRLQVRVEGPSSEALVTLRAVSALQSPGGLALRGSASNEAGFRTNGLSSFMGGPASMAARARALTARADSLESVPAWDEAALAWTAVVAATRGEARSEALFRVAEARFEAWKLSPTPARERSALRGVNAFLAAAPAGGRKDQASSWRRELLR